MNVTVTRNRRHVRQRPRSPVDFESKYDENEETEEAEESKESVQVKPEPSEPISPPTPPPGPSRSLSDAIDRLTETLNRININPALISRDRDKNKRKQKQQQRPTAPRYSMGPFYTEKEATRYNNPENRVDVTDKQSQ